MIKQSQIRIEDTLERSRGVCGYFEFAQCGQFTSHQTRHETYVRVLLERYDTADSNDRDTFLETVQSL